MAIRIVQVCGKSFTRSLSHVRSNEMGIQMISNNLWKTIFKDSSLNKLDDVTRDEMLKNLNKFNLNVETSRDSKAVIDFELPELKGSNIDEHFRQIADMQSGEYVQLATKLLHSGMPSMPKEWAEIPGWTRYSDNAPPEAVDVPKEDVFVFDVEVLMSEGDHPTMATAVSDEAWYSWCSPRVFDDHRSPLPSPRQEELIALGGAVPRLMIAHNAGFDRAFVLEQYNIECTKLRLLDTMSLHIACSGLTGDQRIVYMAKKKGNSPKELKRMRDAEMLWTKVTSLNNLSDVHRHYCGPVVEPLDKDLRQVFVGGTMADVRENFQALMTYCAHDSRATLQVHRRLWPLFQERFPHPVTFAGMLEMGQAMLPVNASWPRYLQQSEAKYFELLGKMKEELMSLAKKRCLEMSVNDKYKSNVWMFNQDWSTRSLNGRKSRPDESHAKLISLPKDAYLSQIDSYYKLHPRKRVPHMVGYPLWFADLCPKDDPCEPSLISIQRRVTPLLLHLKWLGYPLLYSSTYGWGYVVPDNSSDQKVKEVCVEKMEDYPLQQLNEMLAEGGERAKCGGTVPCTIDGLANCDAMFNDEDGFAQLIDLRQSGYKASPKVSAVKVGGLTSVYIPGARFIPLPHKKGEGSRVGSPLGKDFVESLAQGLLSSEDPNLASIILQTSQQSSYWKNSRDRICSQMVVWSADRSELHGVILPRVVVAGTMTRRAVEKTWLTASNARHDRIGSELKAMVQAPPGFHFVGADVDSQELWIASLLGDSRAGGIHGCTPLGWMTVEGSKADGTDLHSKTASLVNVSRDQAKVINYSRIYGAGQKFSGRLLQQFDSNLSPREAADKARVIFSSTKGKRIVQKVFNEETMQVEKTPLWQGGTESHMFNQLESIAQSDHPMTPVLSARISRSLEPKYVGSYFMTSRINWVVQSSAVDFLHLMLVSMRWLFTKYAIQGRFCISIHDEIRYLVKSEDRYRAAFALQVTSLLTRSMFSYKVGMPDLPQSVAFFSSVDIDKCLRKETHLNCVTPSNPLGLDEDYKISPGEALSVQEIVSNYQLSAEPKADQLHSDTDNK